MMRSMCRAGVIAAALDFLTLAAAHASDPADIAYWQSIENSKNPKEYSAYLHAFPHGAFAEIAQERVRELGAQNTSAPAGASGPGPVVGKGTIAIVPPNPQVGDDIHLTLDHFPHVTTNDVIVVVPTGTPDTVTAGPTILGQNFATMCVNASNNPYACKFGPFAPGNYEVRWLTQLYNNQQKYQVGARTQFTVAD